MKKIQIAIADDHDEFRETISWIINSEPDFEVSLKAKTGVDLLTQLEDKVAIDLILMDIRMPKMNGIEVSERVICLYPQIKIIALSQFDNDQNIIDMYCRGVKSFIVKGEIDELFKAIRIVNHGGGYLTDQSLQIIQALLGSNFKNQIPDFVGADLTEIEIQVLTYICKGLSSVDISKLIHKSPRTVEKYRTDLYRKFNINNKKQLIKMALPFIKEKLSVY